MSEPTSCPDECQAEGNLPAPKPEDLCETGAYYRTLFGPTSPNYHELAHMYARLVEENARLRAEAQYIRRNLLQEANTVFCGGLSSSLSLEFMRAMHDRVLIGCLLTADDAVEEIKAALANHHGRCSLCDAERRATGEVFHARRHHPDPDYDAMARAALAVLRCRAGFATIKNEGTIEDAVKEVARVIAEARHAYHHEWARYCIDQVGQPLDDDINIFTARAVLATLGRRAGIVFTERAQGDQDHVDQR